MNVIAFTNVAYPWGWLGNMHASPIKYRGIQFRTSEALFQWLRFKGNPKVQARIVKCKSPMGAKMTCKPDAHKHPMVLCDHADLKRMELCVRLKLEQHPELQEELRKSGNMQIIEDCTRRPADIEIDGKNHHNGLPFWGARFNPSTLTWEGFNALGKIWMKLRQRLKPYPINPPSFIGHVYNPDLPMNKLDTKENEYTAKLNEVRSLKKVRNNILNTLKAAKFDSIESFVEKLAAYEEADPSPQARKTNPKKQGKKGGIKRTRLTDSKIAKMKALRGKGLSYQSVADKVGCSAGAVVVWEKKKFKHAA